jgi:hypothetical protein
MGGDLPGNKGNPVALPAPSLNTVYEVLDRFDRTHFKIWFDPVISHRSQLSVTGAGGPH